MSRSSASFSLPREPDFLQHVPAIHGPNEASVLKIQTNTIQSHIQSNAKIKTKKQRALLLLRFVVHQNRGAKRSATDLLHDLVVIHPRLHRAPDPIAINRLRSERNPPSELWRRRLNRFYIASATEPRATLSFSAYDHP